MCLSATTPTAPPPPPKPTTPTVSYPTLMTLEYQDGVKLVHSKVQMKGGAMLFPARGKDVARMRILSGDAFKSDGEPTPMKLGFFQGDVTSKIPLFSIIVRYFKNGQNIWVPHFLIDEEPLVVRGPDGRWKPIGPFGVVVMHSPGLPNGFGFYPSMDIGLTTGPLRIDYMAIY